MPDLNDHSSRAHALLSASSSARWIACPASARLAAKYPAVDTPFTREGTLAHEVAEAVASGREKPENIETNEDTGVDADMVRHAEAYRDYIQSLTQQGSTVMLEQRVDFSPWVPDGFGTADCIILTDDTMDVIDYKYGQGVPVSAVRNPQMMLYGLGAMNEYGFVYDIRKVRLHIFQPRIDNVSVFELDVKDLQRFSDDVAEHAKAALSEDPLMSAGEHCKFCPHAGRCPELAETCLHKITIGDTVAPDAADLTPGAVSFILGIEPMITAWLKSVKEKALTGLMDGAEIPGYKLVEGKLGNRKWSDETAVMAALNSAGYELDDYTARSLLSPSAMDKALGKKRAAELLAGLVERAPGSPTVVPISDKRPKLDRLAQAKDDFNN